ncbi:MAG: putative bifunctional diguanylate cyclase/phosphodiesterase, partial [Bosea sp. (in: a-proteobacteria)]
ARLGGDEFAILAADVSDPAELHELAETAIAQLTAPVIIAGQAVVIGATAGIAVRDAHSGTADELLQNADIALYRAKSAGKGLACFYEPSMGEALRLRRQMEIDLRSAIARNELTLHYQPVVSASCGKTVACEALLRWRHDERNIGPAEFIPIAEETGLMIPIGEWVIREACLEAARWPAEISIAVNLSPVQFRSPGLLPTVVQALASSGLDPARLELEITETVMMADDRTTWLTLNGLRSLGVRIALDDFGVGHSSLSYLHRFRFDKIKIDRSFVSSIESDPVNGAIVRAVIRLGAELGISIVAEGVETQAQATALRIESCQLFQGYLFGRPGEAAGLSFPRADWPFKRKGASPRRMAANAPSKPHSEISDQRDEQITPEQVISEFDLVSEQRHASRRR